MIQTFLYAGHGIYLGGASPLWGRCRNCQPLANIKGVRREVESEESRILGVERSPNGQNSGLTYRNRI